MSFQIPRKIDDWLTIQYIIFFLIGFFLNVFSNGQATLIFIDDYYGVDQDSVFEDTLYFSEKQKYIKEFENHIYTNNKFVWLVTLLLYFVISPLINFYYAFFVFKKGSIWID